MAQFDISTVTARAFDRPTILVIDDARENLAVIGHILEADYRVRLANSGHRGLEAAATEPRPSLILLDIVMPEMDGYTVLARLKEDPATRDIPVIFISALNATDDEQRGLALGAVDYITKPLRPGIVRARVDTHLELKRARDRLQDQAVFLEAEVKRRMAGDGVADAVYALREPLRAMATRLQALERLLTGGQPDAAKGMEIRQLLAESREGLQGMDATIARLRP